jgi:hypothetical protein
MRLFKRHRDEETTKAPCPRCGVPVPVEAVECAACGWDTRDRYVPPVEPGSSGSRSRTEDDA